MITRVELLSPEEFIITCLSDVIGPDGEEEIDGYWNGRSWNDNESRALRFTDVGNAQEIAESLAEMVASMSKTPRATQNTPPTAASNCS